MVQPINHEELLLDRCKTNLAILQSNLGAQQIIFSDYDIIFNRLPEPSSDEALLLTIRKAQRYPINGGLLSFSRPSAKSVKLYATVLEHYKLCKQEELKWWGDQISLYQALLGHSQDLLSLQPFEIGGLQINPVSADEYNWTPFDMNVSPKALWDHFFLTAEMVEEYNRHAVVHFKGPRKHLMMQYARTEFGKELGRLPRWASRGESQDLELKIDRIKAELKQYDQKQSIWGLADEIFSLLSLLKKDNPRSPELKSSLLFMLDTLSSIHQDFRFNLVLNKDYATQKV
jgi:hypothetical protein